MNQKTNWTQIADYAKRLLKALLEEEDLIVRLGRVTKPGEDSLLTKARAAVASWNPTATERKASDARDALFGDNGLNTVLMACQAQFIELLKEDIGDSVADWQSKITASDNEGSKIRKQGKLIAALKDKRALIRLDAEIAKLRQELGNDADRYKLILHGKGLGAEVRARQSLVKCLKGVRDRKQEREAKNAQRVLDTIERYRKYLNQRGEDIGPLNPGADPVSFRDSLARRAAQKAIAIMEDKLEGAREGALEDEITYNVGKREYTHKIGNIVADANNGDLPWHKRFYAAKRASAALYERQRPVDLTDGWTYEPPAPEPVVTRRDKKRKQHEDRAAAQAANSERARYAAQAVTQQITEGLDEWCAFRDGNAI